jgi:Trp operon repressor
MVNVNKKYLDEEFKGSVWRDFVNELKKAKTEKDLEKTIAKALTSSEKTMVEKRLGILALLKKGFKQRDIGRALDAVPGTVRFVKRGLDRTPRSRRPYTPDRPSGASRKKRSRSKFPTYKGKGRWRFLDSY